MEMMQDSMGKRERTGQSYKEGDFYRARGGVVQVDKSMPKMRKLPDMKDFQLFNTRRIIELYEKEHQAELKRARAIQRAAEAGAAAESSRRRRADRAELKEMEELKQLEQEGFSDWTRGEFTKFTKACERLGRDKLKEIADDIGTKSVEDVATYAEAFWQRGALAASRRSDFDKILKRIEEGERKIAEKAKMAEALSSKVKLVRQPVADAADQVRQQPRQALHRGRGPLPHVHDARARLRQVGGAQARGAPLPRLPLRLALQVAHAGRTRPPRRPADPADTERVEGARRPQAQGDGADPSSAQAEPMAMEE